MKIIKDLKQRFPKAWGFAEATLYTLLLITMIPIAIVMLGFLVFGKVWLCEGDVKCLMADRTVVIIDSKE